MDQRIFAALFGVVATLVPWHSAFSAEPVTLATVVAPSPNRPDETIAQVFSVEKAAHFLDSAALQWQKQRKCMTCHTNYAYLYARPGISDKVTAHQEVRSFAEQLVNQRWQDKGPRSDAEVVATAAALSFNDEATTGKLHRTTRAALDRMWTVQKTDGSWSWIKCGWPPFESDDHYGVTLAAIAVSVAPDDYSKSDAAQQGLTKIRNYFKHNSPPTLHHQAMLLWAGNYGNSLISEDGGWALATLGDWKRADGTEQDITTSDGYGTGLVIFVLRRAGVLADSPPIKRGVAWLKSHQRESGRWFTRSLNKDNKHFISHAGTAMAVMAFAVCDELR